MVLEYLPEALKLSGMDMVFYMLTSLQDQSTRVLYAGPGAEVLLRRAFDTDDAEEQIVLPGVVSRKKQFIPGILQATQE